MILAEQNISRMEWSERLRWGFYESNRYTQITDSQFTQRFVRNQANSSVDLVQLFLADSGLFSAA